MELKVKRLWKKPTYTIGKLYVDGKYHSETLEDKDRGITQDMPEWEIIKKKCYGFTAIGTGRYRVRMDVVSQKFKNRSWAQPYGGRLPRLEDVPGFDGILIHVGNSPADTNGCVLTGYNRVRGKVVDSTKAFKALMDNYLVPASKRGEEIWITIE